MESFMFQDREYDTVEELLAVMAEQWEDGKTALFDGSLREYFREPDPELAEICGEAQKEAGGSLPIPEEARGDIAYLIWLNRMPGERPLFWKGSEPELPEGTAAFVKDLCRREGVYYRKKYVYPLLNELLLEEREFSFDGQSFADLDALAAWLQSVSDQSPAKLRTKSAKLFLDESHLDPVFAGWLLKNGEAEAAEHWNRRFGAPAEAE